MNTWIIYCHTHLDSGRKYVGLTKFSIEIRWQRHIYSAFSGEKHHFARAVQKYGPSAFQAEELERCSSLDEANKAEIRWIKELETCDPAKGFNSEKGGSGPIKELRRSPWDDPTYRARQLERLHSPEWKERMNRPETKAKMSLASKGRLVSEETRQKLAVTSTGRKHSSATIAKLTGVRKSPETKAKMSLAQKSKPPKSKEHIAKWRAKMDAKPKKTHCKRGHSLEDAYQLASGKRQCRTCAKNSAKDWRLKKKK